MSLTPSDHRPFVRFDPIRPTVDTENTILIFICIFTSLAGKTAAQNQPPAPSFLGVRQPQNSVREAEGERHPAVFIITQTEEDQRPTPIDYRTR